MTGKEQAIGMDTELDRVLGARGLSHSQKSDWSRRGDRPAPRFFAAGAKRISCIVCAYNEEDRIRNILDAVDRHPALSEVIVVNDGSTDATEALLAGYPDIQVISYAPNRGKTYALSRGIAAARHDCLMLLDADLAGVTARDIDALAAPVVNGEADVSISLRRNSLAIYRGIGLDFVSGERVLPAWLVRDAVRAMERLPRWGGEAFMNDLIIKHGCRLAVVDWPAVFNIRKYSKLGPWRGALSELAMMRDALSVLTPWGVVRQNLALLRLVRSRPPKAAGQGRQIESAFDISFRRYFLISQYAARSTSPMPKNKKVM
ncbi:MAG: glycosyltransferase family 2 protein [Pseudomonadota bacterium]